jgi:threonylcarbamoyladenosine tRNA methylthiotransferase MtaB
VKFLIRTHGCRANQYDSEQARRMLIAGGGVEVTRAEEADIAIFNSCSVTAAAEAELRKDVRRAARSNPRLRSVVMGCAPGVSVRDESIAPLRTLPTVTSAITGADLPALAATLELPAVRFDSPGAAQSGARALLRIQDGCDEHCTFCVTTLSRGANRSRSAQDLVTEATTLAESHHEIVLTGIHIGSYGADIGSSLSLLVEMLITRVPNVRFRLSSLEATEVDDRLRELYSERRRLASYLHAPLQSGSNRILKRMGRHWYSAESYENKIMQLMRNRDVFGLGADVIVGFPGETDQDHAATLSLVDRLPFTSLHVFPFSPRPGTAAPRLGAPAHSTDIARRSRELRDLAGQKAAEYRARRTGGIADVVTISSHEGVTEDYLSVDTAASMIGRRQRFVAQLSPSGDSLSAIPIQTQAA